MSEPASNPTDTIDPADPWARAAQMFPLLAAGMGARVAQYGTVEEVAAGATLFERGNRATDFFLVLEGEVELFDREPCGTLVSVRVLGAGQFTGELDLLNERMTLVSARVESAGRVVRIDREKFRRLLSGEPDIAEILMRAFILRRVGFIRHAQGGVVLLGPGHGADTLRVRRFLTRNGYPHRLLDTEADPDASRFLGCFGLDADALPAVIRAGEAVLRNPGTGALADALGLTEAHDPRRVYDVAIVGAWPAGLAAAVYAASEGLATIAIEGTAPGGQAGTSSKIENYLGFPTGISGQALAGRAQVQAQKFGAHLAISRQVVGIACGRIPYVLRLEDGQAIRATAVVVASGARYRRLDVAGVERFEGAGIHYAATAMEQALCGGEEVVVVGGGNSAGQAAMFLSRTCAHVHVLVRGEGLASTMSDYLVQRIAGSAQITLHVRSEITALEGDDRLRRVTWTRGDTGESETHGVSNLFLMLGAEPNTEWLDGCLALDAKGFVRTGSDADGMALASPFATTLPGLFAIGDVRAGSVKRVASGVGEGSVVISAVHAFLDEVRAGVPALHGGRDRAGMEDPSQPPSLSPGQEPDGDATMFDRIGAGAPSLATGGRPDVAHG